jgi:ribosome maturation factor RimP
MFRNSPLERAIFFAMNPIRERLIPIVTPVVEQAGAYLVDLVFKVEHRSRIVQVQVDTDAGVTIDTCTRISRELGPILDAVDGLQGPFRLEVTSPGADKPLRMLRQYPRHLGRPFRLKVRSAEGTQAIRGRLRGVEGSVLTFDVEGAAPVAVSFDDILESFIELPW